MNAWLLYHRALKQENRSVTPLAHAEFKADIAESLYKVAKLTVRKRSTGRPQNSNPPKKQRLHGQPLPQDDIHMDGVDHFP